MTDRRLARAVSSGSLIRLRGGLYCTPDCNPEVQRAARIGGRLACASLLQQLGVWVLADTALHVHFVHTPRRRAPVTRHREALLRIPEAGGVHVVDALLEAIHCLPRNAAVAALDSARHLGLVDEADLSDIHGSSARSAAIVALSDARAESGLETLARLIVVDLGLRSVPQVRFSGIGRVDLLVEDRVVIEADGDAFHADPRSRRVDRRRDAMLSALDRPVLRFGYEQLVERPDEVARSLISTLARHRGVKDARRMAKSALKRARGRGWA